MCKYLNIFLKICVLVATTISVIEAVNPCLTPQGTHGECKPLHECQSLYQHFKANSTRPRPRVLEYVRRSHCGFLPTEPKVCCHSELESNLNTSSTAQFVSSDLLPDLDHCGISTEDKIYGGEATQLDEYPWMALLDYEDPDFGTRYFNCGGALINPRYVLTAAHCIEPNLKSVHLGVYNKALNVSCIGNDCTDPVIEIEVEKAIPFKSYNSLDTSSYHDIALLRLKEPVTYSDFIKPICLPLTIDEIFNTHLRENVAIAGWGETEKGRSSSIKLKLNVPVRECKQYGNSREIQLDSAQICAGGVSGQDSCRGDSGGPLMASKLDNKKKDLHSCVIGVLSFGTTPCGKYTPGVYTKVAKYGYWIVDNLEP